MIAHKYIARIIAVVMTVAVFLCFCAIVFSNQIASEVGDNGISMEYETKLFDINSVLTVNILMDEADWNNMLENAAAEEYYQCDVEIDGTTFYRVAIRPKGNTSLTSIASDPTTDRYSFKLEFDYYVDGQTCYGLDKLVLNNNYADATNMKEALIYDMYQYLDADASLYTYAKISVNGEYWGVYLALEAVEDSFMLRNYGAQNGELYKPESTNMGGGDFDAADMDFSDMDFDNMDFGNMTPPSSQESKSKTDSSDFSSQMPDASDTPPNAAAGDDAAESSTDSSERPSIKNSDLGGGMGGFSMGENGADLNYSDDDLDSYSTIWEGEVTKTTDADHKRVVTALKNISEGTNLETYMDIDNLLRYMAVHVFSVNEDSLSGMMAHNYYLYESDGMLNLIPWDYNLALGGMGSGNNATSVVNDAIDNAFSGTSFFDTLMEDDTYHNQYYAYLQQLVSEYIDGGGFDEFYERVRSQIDELVETDPTAFYSYDEYLTAVDTLYQVVKLRGESIQGQLDGTIPSTEAEQRSSEALVDAPTLDISVMGSMSNGGDAGGFGFEAQSAQTITGENRTDGGQNALKVSPASNTTGETGDDIPSDFGSSQEGVDPSQSTSATSDENDKLQSSDETQNSEEDIQQPSENAAESRGMDGFENMPSMGNFPGSSSGGVSQSNVLQNLTLYGISLIVAIIAVLFALLYRRKPRRR